MCRESRHSTSSSVTVPRCRRLISSAYRRSFAWRMFCVSSLQRIITSAVNYGGLPVREAGIVIPVVDLDRAAVEALIHERSGDVDEDGSSTNGRELEEVSQGEHQ